MTKIAYAVTKSVSQQKCSFRKRKILLCPLEFMDGVTGSDGS